MTRPTSISDLYTRLDEVGFPSSYVKDRILPEWWEDDLAGEPGNRRLAELTISRTLKIPLETLVNASAPLSLSRAQQGVRFKRWQDAEAEQLRPAVAIARRACELLLSCAKNLPPLRLPGTTASDLRERILRQHEYIHLDALLQSCWINGVPVIHLDLPKGSKRVDGMALDVGGRPCVVLTSPRTAPWLVWHGAHEMGHIARRHVGEGDALLDESIEFDSVEQAEEQEATSFAVDLVYGERNRNGFRSRFHLKAEKLVDFANNCGRTHKVWPPSVALSYGRCMDAFPTANAALDRMNVSHGPQAIRLFVSQRVDLNALPDTDRHFFASVTGIPE